MKTVLIVVIGNTGSEHEALRQSLECFGYFVATKYIGRPMEFIDLLKGGLLFDPDCIILSCHGDEGNIVMPILDERIYEPDEPRGNLSASDIQKYLTWTGKMILNLGCTTGSDDLARVFSRNNLYIAPGDYVQGNAALYFALSLFYELSKTGTKLEKAYMAAKAIDRETECFLLHHPQIGDSLFPENGL